MYLFLNFLYLVNYVFDLVMNGVSILKSKMINVVLVYFILVKNMKFCFKYY